MSWFRGVTNPQGPSTQTVIKVLGPKIHTLNGLWTLKPYYFGVLGPFGEESSASDEDHSLASRRMQRPIEIPRRCFVFFLGGGGGCPAKGFRFRSRGSVRVSG